jgi:hypothetical protein
MLLSILKEAYTLIFKQRKPVVVEKSIGNLSHLLCVTGCAARPWITLVNLIHG